MGNLNDSIWRGLSQAVYNRFIEHSGNKIPHTEVELLTNVLGQQDMRIQDYRTELDSSNEQISQLNIDKKSLQNTLAMSSSTCKKTVAELSGKMNVLSQALIDKDKTLLAFQNEIEALRLKQDIPPLPTETLAKLMESYSKYPEANIFLTSHYFGAGRHVYNIKFQDWFNIGVGMLEMVDKVRGINAFVAPIMKNETGGDFHRACDIATARVAVGTPCNYVFDQPHYGINDYAAFAPEVHFEQSGDCDCYMAYRAVLNKIAGVPDILQRGVEGNTRGSQEGHATNAYFASDMKWHHINSTTTFPSSFKTATSAPNIHDTDDRMGLGFTWFSGNAEKTFQGFQTQAHEEAFARALENERLLRKLKFIHNPGARLW